MTNFLKLGIVLGADSKKSLKKFFGCQSEEIFRLKSYAILKNKLRLNKLYVTNVNIKKVSLGIFLGIDSKKFVKKIFECQSDEIFRLKS